MQFLIKDITKITGVTRGRLNQWMKMGILQPSIIKASKPGVKNVFSLKDVYRIALYKDFIDGRDYRDKAVQYIKAVEDDSIDCLLRHKMGAGLFPIKKYFESMYDAGIDKIESSSIDGRVKLIIDGKKKKETILNHKLFAGKYFLVFVRFRTEGISKIICRPAIETDFKFPIEIQEGKKIAPSLHDLKEFIMAGNDSYILNYGKIMDKVDEAINEIHPINFLNQDEALKTVDSFLDELIIEDD